MKQFDVERVDAGRDKASAEDAVDATPPLANVVGRTTLVERTEQMGASLPPAVGNIATNAYCVGKRTLTEALEQGGPGATLPDGAREQLESQTGYRLEQVRVHTSDAAAEAALLLGAAAFTIGSDIFFARGKFEPDSEAGRRLLAHEVRHVVQAWEGRTTRGGGPQVGDPHDELEQEAETFAMQASSRSQVGERTAPKRAPRGRRKDKTQAANVRRKRSMVEVLAGTASRRPPLKQPSSSRGSLILRRPDPGASSQSSVHDIGARALGVGPTPTAAERHARTVEVTERAFHVAQDTAAALVNRLVPAYLKARDNLDTVAVAEIGGSILAALGIFHGAHDALLERLPSMVRKSVRGSTAIADLDQADRLQFVVDRAPMLAILRQTVDRITASTLTPAMFKGVPVAGRPLTVDVTRRPEHVRSMKLAAELERTLEMLSLVNEIRAKLGQRGKLFASRDLDDARRKLGPWASRPLDLAFIRAALGPLWKTLDTEPRGPLVPQPSALFEQATKTASKTGWLGDVGNFDLGEAVRWLKIGGRDGSEFVRMMLNSADPDTRAKLLGQIRGYGAEGPRLFDRLCEGLGWEEVKDLHDHLGLGYGEIKAALQPHFLGRGKYGPALGEEWSTHNVSSKSLIARLGTVGDVANGLLDVATFGFHSAYGKAEDDHAQGLTSGAEFRSAKMHASAETAATAAVSLLTAGTADKLIRGSEGAGALRTTLAGITAGGVGGVSAVATSDLYRNYISGTQQGATSVADYVKAGLLGGALGGTLANVTRFLGPRSRGYLPEEPPPSSAVLSSSSTSKTGNPRIDGVSDPHAILSNGSRSEPSALGRQHPGPRSAAQLGGLETRTGGSGAAARSKEAGALGLAPTWDDVVAMETAPNPGQALRMADGIVAHPDATYHHNVYKGGTRAIVESQQFKAGDGTASFGGERSVRAYIGEVNPSAAKSTKYPIIEFSTDGGEIPCTRLYQGRPGAYWVTDEGLTVKIHKVYLPDGRVAIPEGNGLLKIVHPDGTTGRMSVSELPE